MNVACCFNCGQMWGQESWPHPDDVHKTAPSGRAKWIGQRPPDGMTPMQALYSHECRRAKKELGEV